MVGVPGRSRACRQCRGRKISCDATRPACNRCARLKLPCDYAQPLIFVNNDRTTQREAYRVSLRNEGTGTSKSDGQHGSTALSDKTIRHSEAQQTSSLVASVSSGPSFRQQLVSYATTYAEPGSDLTGLPLRSWLAALTSSAKSSGELAAAPLACFTAWLGRRECNHTMVDFSRQLYIQGMAETRLALCDRVRALQDQTMAACLALMRYEILECPSQTMAAYHWHRAGCLQLAALRGAHAHEEGLGHQLISEIRTHGILRAIEMQHATFLRSREWTNRPWSKHPKSQYDRLIDIFAKAPAVLQVAAGLSQEAPERVPSVLAHLLRACSALDRELDHFLTSLDDLFPQPLYWESHELTSEYLRKLISSGLDGAAQYHFQSLELAQLLSLTWAIQAMLWAGLDDLAHALQSYGIWQAADTTSLPEPGVWVAAIRKVLASVSYCLETSRGHLGGLAIAGPLNIAISTMQPRGKTAAELETALALRRHLGDLGLRILSCA